MVSKETGLAKITEIDKMIMALPDINTIPDARRLLALAQGYVTIAQKLYKGNSAEITTINEANDDKSKSYDIAKKAGELRLYAEARLGELIKSEQEAGRLASQDSGNRNLSNNVVTLSDYGLTRMDSSRAQELAKHKDIIAKVIVESLDIPTRNAVLKEIKEQEHEQKKQETSPDVIPEGLFEVIVIDPPWNYERDYDPFASRVASPYKEMSVDEIMMLEIPAADNCILWLWTTNKFMHDAYHILEAWAFEPKTILTWYKKRTGVGYWLRGDTEHCILAVKGKPVITHVAQSSFLSAKAGEHSEKPTEFYELVESLCPGNKLEMFARREHEGWYSHGNQL